MSFGFLNLAMLAGLAAVAIPILIHLLHRRRYQVVDWGAMQFLQLSETTRRRLLLEELLLLALRMGLIALLVLALAAPYAVGSWLSYVQPRPSRDLVLVLDMSSSMTRTDATGKSTFAAAQAWIGDFLGHLQQGDRIAVLLARQPPEWLVGDFTLDHALVRERTTELPPPRGNPDWPRTLAEAWKFLRERGQQPRQDIVILSDNQRHGWADTDTLTRWQKTAHQLGWHGDQHTGNTTGLVPNIWYVDVAADGKGGLSNYALGPLKTTRALAWSGQRLKFTGSLHADHVKTFAKPFRLYFEVDGHRVEDIGLAEPGSAKQVAFAFQHRFTEPGTHLISVILEPDLPSDQQPSGHEQRDCLPADNRQDLALEVVRELPVLLIDGAARPAEETSATFFLQKALGGPADAKQPALVLPRVVAGGDFAPDMLTASRPRVVVLADVPEITPALAEALEQYVAEGGGLLVALGPRCVGRVKSYNDLLYRQGQGILPARLDAPEGDEAKPEFAASLDPRRFQHAALELFKQESGGAFDKVRFPRWWKVTTPTGAGGTPVAMLSSGVPFLVERDYKKGRVLLCTVPFDRSWGSTFPGQWEYPVLMHELVYSLAEVRSTNLKLQPGQPARLLLSAFGLGVAPVSERLLLTMPSGKAVATEVDAWPAVFEHTGEVGPYRVQSSEGKTAYFVVDGDPRETDLSPCTDEDRDKVRRHLPFQLLTHAALDDAGAGSDLRQDLWWIFLIGVMLFLCLEIWWTRKMARARTA